MNKGPYIVYLNAKLSKVFRLYKSNGIKASSCNDEDNYVVGMLTRKVLMTDFKSDLL